MIARNPGHVPPPRARDARRDIGVHQDSEIWLQAATQNLVQCRHWPAAQLAPSALVGFGGIGETVAEHEAALGQRRLDNFLDVLGAGGKHQGELGQG